MNEAMNEAMSEPDTSGNDPENDAVAQNRDGEDVPAGAEQGTDRIDPTATGVDVRAVEHEIEGWGGSSMPPHELTPEQEARLQDRPEPIGGGETGRALHGDQGNADPVWQADAPETREPDTSLGHGGGKAGDPDSGSR
jgi:hypothetical protein